MLSFVIVTSTLLFIQLLAVHAVPLTPSSPSSHLSIKRQALGSQLWFPTTTFKPIANRHAAPFQRGHSNNTNGTTTSPAPNSINYTISNPVLTGDTTIYIVYYGDFLDTETPIIEDFIGTLSDDNDPGTKWWSTTRQYYSQASTTSDPQYITGNILLGQTIHDDYSHGKSLNGTNIPDILDAHINSGELPEDPNAIYLFASAGDVTETIRPDLGPGAFCQDYCGYHVSWLRGQTRLFYAFVGNPTSCLAGCSPNNQNVSPNGSPGVDAMISVIAHELTEAVTDPVSDVDTLRAWQDAQGAENADKCAYVYGNMTSENGYKYNIVQGSRKYLIQQNWSPAAPQGCHTSVSI